MRTVAALCLSALLVAGCDDAEDPVHGGGGGAGGNTTVDARQFHVEFGPVTVQPGQENTQCVVKRLGNAGSVHIGAIHNDLGNASHHLILYRVSDTVEKPEPFDCEPFTDTLDPTKGSTLMISQKKDDLLQLPAGVGYTLDDNQMVRIEMHYINASDTPQTLVATTTMTEVPPAAFQDEANFLFIGSPDIKIPPHSKQTLGPLFFELPADLSDANFFAMTGHQHHHGKNVTVDLVKHEEDTGTPVYNVPDWVWSEPKTVQFSPTLQVPKGGGFSFTCSWDNTSDETVKFGESANDEMCFFWAYYYPSKGTGSKVCISSPKLAPFGKKSLCCPGDDLCALIEN